MKQNPNTACKLHQVMAILSNLKYARRTDHAYL